MEVVEFERDIWCTLRSISPFFYGTFFIPLLLLLLLTFDNGAQIWLWLLRMDGYHHVGGKYPLLRVTQIPVFQIAGHFWKEQICQVAKFFPIFVSGRNKDYNRTTKKLTEIQKWQKEKDTQKTRAASSYLSILTINLFHLLLPATTFIIILQDRAERERETDVLALP